MTMKYLDTLREAASRVGLSVSGAELIRVGSNALYRLPGGIVARVSRPGRQALAAKEVAVARWLARHDIPAVEPLPDLEQPVLVNDRAVTFWRELPPHRSGTLRDVGMLLRRLHALPLPTGFDLPRLDPLAGVADRIQTFHELSDGERAWLTNRVSEVEQQYTAEVAADQVCVIHGDAHTGNVVTTEQGTTLFLDFERVAIGPAAWDLVSIAVLSKSVPWIPEDRYADFATTYGQDVTTWPHYTSLRDIRELRMTCYTAQLIPDHPTAKPETSLRIQCLQGQHGQRPWPWKPM